MSLEIEATYENGILRLDEPLPLNEHERVVVTVQAKASRQSDDEQAIRRHQARERIQAAVRSKCPLDAIRGLPHFCFNVAR